MRLVRAVKELLVFRSRRIPVLPALAVLDQYDSLRSLASVPTVLGEASRRQNLTSYYWDAHLVRLKSVINRLVARSLACLAQDGQAE